jgi:hypothetical protein
VALLLVVAIHALGVFAPVRGNLVIRSRERRLIVVPVPAPTVWAAAIVGLRLITHIAGCQPQRTAFTRRGPASFATDTVRAKRAIRGSNIESHYAGPTQSATTTTTQLGFDDLGAGAHRDRRADRGVPPQDQRNLANTRYHAPNR